jgi:putative membrane protein
VLEHAATRFLRLAARGAAARHLAIAVEGLEQVPREGPLLLAARHYHHLHDGVVLLAVLPRPIHLLVALDWVETARLRRTMEWATRTARWPAVLRAERLVGAPARSAYRADEVDRLCLRAMRDAVGLLVEHRALVVFPEAYPTIDPNGSPKTDPDEILPFRRGIGAIAVHAATRLRRPVPIVPVGLRYTSSRRWRVALRCGAPISVDAGARPAAIAGVLEQRVRALSAARPLHVVVSAPVTARAAGAGAIGVRRRTRCP